MVNTYDAHGCDVINGCIVGVGNQGKRGAVGWSGQGPGKSQASRTMVHELGHNLNRKHVFCSGSEDNIGKNYPYPDGKIWVWGLDIEERKLIDPNSFFDFMNYCHHVWTSDYTYWNIFQFRDSNLLMGSGIPFDGEAMYIRGTVSPEGEVTLLPVYRHRIATLSAFEGPYVVDVLDDRGQVIGIFNFEMIDIADTLGHRHFGFFIPALPGSAGLRLREGERTLVEKSIQPGFDQFQSPEKSLVVDFVGDRIRVRWPEVSHPYQPVYYRVRFSRDNGISWQVLALDWRESKIFLQALFVSERSQTLLEIQASDGIHTSTQIYPLL